MIIIKPIIGIISREYRNDTYKKLNIVYDDIFSSIISSGGIPIGIPYNVDLSNYINLCNGFIFQGGDEICDSDLRNIDLLKKENIPTLGICLGMQEMFYQCNLVDIPNHHINSLHEIRIKRNTLLYKIVKKDRMLVNSRHKSSVRNTNHKVSSISRDGVIESIEIPYLKFFLGLQWHPENLYSIDSNSRKIFDYFVKICNNM